MVNSLFFLVLYVLVGVWGFFYVEDVCGYLVVVGLLFVGMGVVVLKWFDFLMSCLVIVVVIGFVLDDELFC